MSSGARVVIALLGAVGAIAVLAVIVFLVTDEPGVRCVEGELQDNPTAAGGQVRPRVAVFRTRPEAEAFVCRRIPYPRDTRDLELKLVRVAREGRLADLIEGSAGATIELEYDTAAGEPTGIPLRLSVSFLTTSPPFEAPFDQKLKVRGRDADLVMLEEMTVVRWQREGFTFVAFARLSPGFTLEELRRLLDSVR